MERRAILSPILRRIDPLPPDRIGVGPNALMARSLISGGSGLCAPFFKAAVIAQRGLSRNGLNVAASIAARWSLRDTLKAFQSTTDAEGQARRTQPTMETLLRAGVREDHLVRVGSPELRGVLEAALAWRCALRELGCIAGGELYREATKCVVPLKDLSVWGYARLYPEELAFLNAAAGEGSRLYFPCGEHPVFADNRRRVEEMRAYGWRIEHDDTPPATVGEMLAYKFLYGKSTSFQSNAIVYADIEDEIRGVLAHVKRLLLDGVSPGEIAITARDEPLYGPYALSISREYGIPVRAFYSIPLAETKLGIWLLLLLDCLQRDYPFETTARLLQHSYTAASVADWRVWPKARMERPQGRSAWIEQGVECHDSAQIHKDTRGGFMEWLKKLLGGWLNEREVMRQAREAVALRRLEEGITQAALWKTTEEITLNQFLAELREVLYLQTVNISPGRGGVELHSPHSLQGARFKHMFVLGMAEGVMPAAIQDDSVLDFHARMELLDAGLPLEGPVERAQREAISFWAMLHAAEDSIHFSYPRVIHGKEKLPSPFLDRVGASLQEPPRKVIASIPEKRRLLPLDEDPSDEVASRAAHSRTVELRRECDAAYDLYDGIIGEALDRAPRVFSVTQLTQLGQCPFRWFGHRVLGLKEFEEAETDLNAKSRGDFCHRVLCFAVEGAQNGGDVRRSILDRLPEAFERVESDMRLTRLPAWPSRRRELFEKLRLAIQSEDFLLAGSRILFCEKEFEANWRGFRIKGIIDRVDEGVGGWVLVDYKTSSQRPAGIKDENGKATLDLQLEIYSHAIASLNPETRVWDAYYYSLTKAKKISAVSASDEVYTAFAESIGRRLQEGRYPVAPDVEGKACEYCELDALCRKGPRLARKEEAL